MAVLINPMRLSGHWDAGYVLDRHIVKSVPLGDDEYGHPQFDNTRSPIGELLYQFKYRRNFDCLTEIIDTIDYFLDNVIDMSDFDVIIPVPPTQKLRLYQPVFMIANALAVKRKIPYVSNVLAKNSKIESKSLSSVEKRKLNGSIVKQRKCLRPTNVLLIDDLYGTGCTLNQCTDVLRKDSNIKKIYVLAITKTKN